MMHQLLRAGLLFVVVAGLIPAYAQTTDSKKLRQLTDLLDAKTSTGNKKVKFVAPYILDSLIIGYQKALSGSEVEAGKLIGSSVSVTDKGATANIGVSRIGSTYGQVTISGQGKENLISLLEKGKYGNTISAGGQLQIFLPSSGKFYPADKNRLHNSLLLLKDMSGTFTPGSSATRVYDSTLHYIFRKIKTVESNHIDYIRAAASTDDLTTVQRQSAAAFFVAADTLIKLGLLPADFLNRTKDEKDQQLDIGMLTAKWTDTITGTGPDTLRLKSYLGDAESLQLKAKWSSLSFQWFSVAAGYNVTPYNLLDTNAKADNYTKVYYDQFLTASFAYNFLRAWQGGDQLRFYMSPTISFSTGRVFEEADKQTLSRFRPYVIGNDTLANTEMSSDVYKSFVGPNLALTLETPFIWYWNKKNIGFEVSPKLGINDPKGDNVGLRVGVFIPAQIKDGVPVLVEPLVRLQKLFATGGADFLKDNFVVGFNVSVTLPKGFSKIGN